MGRCWTVALAMLAAMCTASAQDSGRTVQDELAGKLDLFHLCTVVPRVDLAVNELPGHAAGAGLTQERFRESIERRLRAARIHDPNADPLLQVLVVVGEPDEGHIPFYSIEVSFLRDLVAEPIGISALAETWSMGGAGQGSSDAFHDHLGALVDRFVADYLRVRDSKGCLDLRRARASEGGPRSGG